MVIRELKENDIPRINMIHEKYHKDTAYIPHLSNVLAHGVVEEEGNILGYGALIVSGEAFMILDLSSSIIKRGKAIKLLISNLKRAAEARKLDKVLIISENNVLLDHLKKQNEMREIRALILEIDNG